MYARVNTIFGKRHRTEDGVAYIEESDRAAVEATGGNRGLTTFVDRDAGVIVAVSYWDEPGSSSDAGLTRAREGAAAAAEGDLVVETYEVVSRETAATPEPGAAVRMWRVQIEPANVDDGIAFIQDDLLPDLRAGSGFCSAELLIDRHSGNGLFLTAWTSEHDAAGADALLESLPDETVERVATTFPRTEFYEFVRASTTLSG
jgi:hypothetical protein